jgi:hypothetical protein
VQRRELVASRKVQEDLRRQVKHHQCTNDHHEAQVGRHTHDAQRTHSFCRCIGVRVSGVCCGGSFVWLSLDIIAFVI